MVIETFVLMRSKIKYYIYCSNLYQLDEYIGQSIINMD
jgi:hypothetical protein